MSCRTLLATTGVAALLLGLPGPAAATLVHSGDSTIQGSLCVGFDCASNEPMGFATIKIEENNLRIAAADSSSVSGFSTRDWQIEFNSSSSGGGSYFMIRDCGNGGAAGSVDTTCGGTPMLTIEGGADNESIHVDSSGNQGGNVGFGTATPAVDLHVLSGNTPTLRLEQDTSSGFTAQSWDLAGNESNFFIRDVTNGSALPFRIEPGTASNTLYLDNQERIGIGTTAPDATLDIRQSGSRVSVELEATTNNSRWQMIVDSDGDPNEGLSFTRAGTGTREFRLTPAGDLTITGEITTSGSCSIGCDRVFDADYALPTMEEQAAMMWSQKYLPSVGPTPEDGALNVSDKVLRMLNELEKAHIYIDQLNARVKELEALVADKG